MFHAAVTAAGNGWGKPSQASHREEEGGSGGRVSVSDGGVVRVCGKGHCVRRRLEQQDWWRESRLWLPSGNALAVFGYGFVC